VGDWLDQVAPGLRQLPDTFAQLGSTLDALRYAWQTQDLSHLADQGVDSWVMFLLVFGTLYLLVAFAINRVRVTMFAAKELADKARPLRVRRQPWYRRIAAWRVTFSSSPGTGTSAA
jgi:hypothetical protein